MPQGLSGKEKLFVYLVGVGLGLVLLGIIQERREGDTDPRGGKVTDNIVESLMEGSGIRNLPEGSPAYLRDSELLASHRSYPDEQGRFEFIWILEVEEGHPYVRVVEALAVDTDRPEAGIESLGYAVMRADRVVVIPRAGLTGAELAAGLAELGMRPLQRLEALDGWSVDIGERDVYSVPKAIRRLEARFGDRLDVRPYRETRR